MYYINELPIYDIRVSHNNTNNNDIITLKINNKRKYCLVIGKTNTMIKVKNLQIEINNDKIVFIVDNTIDVITKNYLSYTRRIHKLSNIIYNI